VSGGPHEVGIRGTPDQVWAFLWDADALARVLPGCESITAEGHGRYRAALAVRVPLFTVRGDVVAELHDPVPPREVVLTLDGTTRGLKGTLHVRLPIALEWTESVEGHITLVRYDVEVQATGALGAFGPAVLRDALVDEVVGLAVNIEREIAAGRVPELTAP
jgi:2-furoyl-CoA dehydrogenase large subunit